MTSDPTELHVLNMPPPQDIAHVAAHILAGKGKNGFDEKHRGQMMVVTGRRTLRPMCSYTC